MDTTAATWARADLPLDFVASLSFASVLGWGVLLSAGFLLWVQGSLTLAGALFGSFMSEPMILAMTATGGVLLLLGLGLGLLELKDIRVANMLPALVVAPLLVAAAPLSPFEGSSVLVIFTVVYG